jgi:two-component system, NarL family, sensor kinase
MHLNKLFRLFVIQALWIFPLFYSYSQPLESKDTAMINALLSKAGYYLNQLPDPKFHNDNIDSAILLYEKALKLSIHIGDRQNEIKSAMQIGVSYDIKGKYDKAADYLFKALKLSENYGYKKFEAMVLINLGILNFNLRKKENAIEYYTKALKIAEEIHDSICQIKAYNNLGNAYSTFYSDMSKAEPYFLKTVELGRKIGYKDAVEVGLSNLTGIYSNTKQFDKAIETCKQSLNIDPYNGYTLYNLGLIWRLQKMHNKAITTMQEALKYADKELELKQVILQDMAEIYFEKGEYKNSIDIYKQYTSIKDSVHTIQSEKHIQELETKYGTEKKEKEILNLELKEKKKNQFIYILTSIFLVLGLSAVYIIYTIRRKRIIAEQANKIKDQTILQLEKDHQIYAAHAVLKGEEKERSRLSRDLHDGLGGMLSIVKSKLTGMKGNYILNQENVGQFDHAINLLDDSIKELRRVSHNMMPEALVKFGLKDALRDLCDQIAADKKYSIKINYFGESKRLESSLEITIYRIALELVNNSLKHANAGEILVQVVQEDNRIHLTVMDNGKGFDPAKVDTTKSSGLQNIRARVESFNGRIDIDSQPGKGTEIGVEFEIK